MLGNQTKCTICDHDLLKHTDSPATSSSPNMRCPECPDETCRGDYE